MSTNVDIAEGKRSRRPRSSAQATRARVIEAARIAFSQSGFDHVGVREIAARAETDAAIVMRLFGSKEAVFQEVANGAFGLEPAFEVPRAQLGQAIAALLLEPAKPQDPAGEFDAFRFLLHSAASPVAAPIVSASLHAHFIEPLARRLDGGGDASGRAALLTACVLGLSTMRVALGAPALDGAGGDALRMPFAAALQACIDA